MRVITDFALIFALGVAATVSAQIPTDSLVAYYPFNGNANDESGNGNDGTEQGGVSLTEDRFGNTGSAYSFDGVDDYIAIPNTTEMGKGWTDITVSGWFNNSNADGVVFAKDVWNGSENNSLFQINSYASGKVWFGLHTTTDNHASIMSAGSVDINTWNYAVGTYDGNMMRLHLNGQLTDSVSMSGALVTGYTHYDLDIGSKYQTVGRGGYFSGYIDEVRIYNRALSAAEIWALFSEGDWDPPPAAPTSLTAAPGDQQIALTWSPNSEADFLKYYVYGGTATAPTTLVDSTTGGNLNDTTATITGLSNGATYYYRITAVDSSGNESAYSSEVSETPVDVTPPPFPPPASLVATDGTVKSFQKISSTEGNFIVLDNIDRFSWSVAALGDLDGDGVTDLAVGAVYDGDGGMNRGAVYVLFMNTNGTVKSYQKISDTQGNFNAILDDYDTFGNSVAALGDLDGDNIPDLAVGAYSDDDGGPGRGALYILFMNTNGTVKAYQKISDIEGNFSATLDDYDFFGASVTALEDLDGDGVTDLIVGAYHDNDGGFERGAVYVLFMNTNGTVKSYQKISDTQGNFSATLDSSDYFGASVAALGDLDGDGIPDLAVGANFDGDGGIERGAVYILFMNTNGTVKSYQKISDTQGNFSGILDNSDLFGVSVAGLGDLDGDGIPDLAVGAYADDDGGFQRGAVYVLFMNTNGTVKSYQKISDTQGNFSATLDDADFFGISVAVLGDLDGDGVTDFAVGAFQDDDGGTDRGAVYVLFLQDVPPAAPTNLTATPSDGQVSLTWSPNGETDLADYYLYRYTANDSLLAARIDTIPKADTSATDTGLANGTPYWYWVSAVDSAGNESVYSTGVSTTPNPTPFQADSLALVVLYDSTDGANWTNNTNWLSGATLSTWNGVTVSGGRPSALLR